MAASRCPARARAGSQHGVHGPSRIVDPALSSGTTTGWQAPPLASGVDLRAAHRHVHPTRARSTARSATSTTWSTLGVTHVELMPVAEFPGDRGWGYDGVDLYAPHHAYGGPGRAQALRRRRHARGLAVILDVVYNHLGPAGNYLARFGPYFTDRYSTPWGEAINFDGAGSDEVRRFFIDNALMWLRDYHVDGLRLDAVHAIVDMSAVHFLEQLRRRCTTLGEALGRDLVRHRRERSQRSARDPSDRSRRLRPRRAMERRFPPRAASAS